MIKIAYGYGNYQLTQWLKWQQGTRWAWPETEGGDPFHPVHHAGIVDEILMEHTHGVDFAIITHSEHIMLALQRAVRQGRLQCGDLRVHWLNDVEAQRLYVDAKGDFVDDWPRGFFPERLELLR